MLGSKQLLKAAAGAATLCACAAAQAGYTRADAGYTGSVISYNLRETTAATVIAEGDDTLSGFALPFDFTFYGHTYAAGSDAWVSSNGLLGFSRDNADVYCCSQAPVGAADVPAFTVQAGWLDLETMITMATVGAAGSRELVFTWSGSEYDSDLPELFQAILHEGSNDIEFQYSQFNASYQAANVGALRGGAGSAGIAYVDYASDVSLDSLGLLVAAPRHSDLPEPGSMVLLGLGLAGLAFHSRARRA